MSPKETPIVVDWPTIGEKAMFMPLLLDKSIVLDENSQCLLSFT